MSLLLIAACVLQLVVLSGARGVVDESLGRAGASVLVAAELAVLEEADGRVAVHAVLAAHRLARGAVNLHNLDPLALELLRGLLCYCHSIGFGERLVKRGAGRTWHTKMRSTRWFVQASCSPDKKHDHKSSGVLK